MSESLKNLNSFIEDLNLRQPNGAVYFNAKVIFNIDGKRKIKQSEVHIITSNNLGTIYLLNPEISLTQLPDIFEVKKYNSVYTSGQALKLKKGDISVSIYPKAK